MGKIKNENNIMIPLDILDYLSKKSKVNTDELIKSYVTGYICCKNETNKNLDNSNNH